MIPRVATQGGLRNAPRLLILRLRQCAIPLRQCALPQGAALFRVYVIGLLLSGSIGLASPSPFLELF